MNEDKFVIFLDIDGVLVSWGIMGDEYEADGEHAFNQESVIALNAIITYYDADLCMITSWNSSFRNEDEWKAFLVNNEFQ